MEIIKHKNANLESILKDFKLNRVENENLKWNLEKDGKLILPMWFDSLSHNGGGELIDGVWYEWLNWVGLIYLEKPIKSKGVYPYFVKAKAYEYTFDGRFLKIIDKCNCGIWSNEYKEIKRYKYSIIDVQRDGEINIVYESHDFNDAKKEYDRLHNINFAVDSLDFRILNNETCAEFCGGIWYE